MDEKEFEIKYNMFSKILYRIIYGYTNDSFLSDDILQDVFIKYIKLNKKFNSIEDEKYYLIRLTINMCKTYYIKKKKEKEMLLKIQKDEKQLPTNISFYILDLPEKYKSVIILFYYDNYDINSISKILNIKVDAVKKRLERAKKMLKGMMENDV